MSFHLRIPFDNKLLNVRFNKIASPSGKYFIDVNSDELIVASFEMQRDHFNVWKITNAVPEWIVGLESQFAQEIIKNHFLES
jgi:hypothetical protein